MIKLVFDTAIDLIKYSKKYSDYSVKFYYDEDFKTTKLNEQDISSSGYSH